MDALLPELRDKTAVAVQGASEAARVKYQQRDKLLVRERVNLLLDEGPPFLEFSVLAANGLYGDEVSSAGIITGVGRVSGQECMIVANDAAVKGGTYYLMTVKAPARAGDCA